MKSEKWEAQEDGGEFGVFADARDVYSNVQRFLSRWTILDFRKCCIFLSKLIFESDYIISFPN